MTITPLEGPLSLTNDGELSIFFVGCGSAFSKTLYQNNILIVKGDDHVMVDCGTRAPEALSRYGIPVFKIGTYLITHAHADHIGGLEEAMLMGRYVVRSRPKMIVTPGFQRQLWNESLKGGGAHNERVHGRNLRFTDLWEPIRPTPVVGADRDEHEVAVGSISIRMLRTMHIPSNAESWRDSAYSVGIVIDNRVVFSGDTRFDRDFVTTVGAAPTIETIFHDVQFFPGGVHAPLDDLATLPRELRRKMTLMHYGDNWSDKAEQVAELGFAGFARQGCFYRFPGVRS